MKYSGMKKVLALALALVMGLSMLSVGALAAEEIPAVSLMEADMLLPPAEEESPAVEDVPAAEPVTDAAAEEIPVAEETPAEEEAPAPETPEEIYWINPVYAHRVSREDLPKRESVSLDGAAPSFTTVAAAAAYIRQQMVARNEEIVFVFSGDVNTAITAAMTHTGNPKEGDSIAFQLGGWDGEVYSDGTVVLWPLYYSTAMQEYLTDTEVADILDTLALPRASDYETVKVIHDYLCDTVTYNTTGDNTPWTTYGALVQQICVCQGYSLAMYRLLLECGIDCRIISGDGGGPHAWNIVKLGDSYYSVDATWDDQSYGIIYDYFLSGRTLFYREHSPEEGPFEDYSWSSAFWDDYPLALADYDPDNPGGTGDDTGSEEESGGIPINKYTFPDANLRSYVSMYLDLNGSGLLSSEEINAVTELDVSGRSIYDLTGVAFFTELIRLDCYDNSLTTVDVSGLLHLEYLDVSGNLLTSLNLGKQTNLQYLYCEENNLTEVDITGCPALMYFWCYNNSISRLDVSICPELRQLDAGGNGLGSLTLGKQDYLYALYCDNNSLTELDVSGCPELWFMWCHNNALEELDLTGCPQLVELSCYDNYIEHLDVSPCPVLGSLVETITPEYYYDYGIVDYYYEASEDLYYELLMDIGVYVRTRPLRGDVNGDGFINTADAVLVLMHTVGTGLLTGDAATEADVNFDEVIDARDATQILRYWNSLSTVIQ